MLIKDGAWLERRKKRKTVTSSGTADRSTGGVEYAIIDQTQGGELHRVHEIDGEDVRLINRTGFTRDRDLAMAAKAQGLVVVPRDVKVAAGKLFMSMSDLPNYDRINWSHKETHDESSEG